MSSSASAFSVADSLSSARALLGAGRLAEAGMIYESILAADPAHVEALNALAIMAMRQGDLLRARQLLTQALKGAPDDVVSLNHLAQLSQAEGDRSTAMDLYRRVLRAQPTLFVSRLALAQLMTETGERDAALPHYFRAITDAQQTGRWLSAESTLPGLRPQVQAAMRLVDQGRRKMFGEIISSLEARFPRSELARIAGSIELLLGDATYTPPDPRQQPTLYTLPDLPVSPYLKTRQSAVFKELEALTPKIREELRGVMGDATGREEVFRDPALAAANLRSDRGAASWKGYYFYRYGVRNEINAAACPVTMAAIDELPLCKVPKHGPEVLFSVLDAGTHLLPHRGVTNTRVVGHLPLIVPPDCALKVADVEHRWKEGQVVLFDDTFMHEAWNRSDQQRVVLIFDLWHPHMSQVERIAVTELLEMLGSFNAAAHL